MRLASTGFIVALLAAFAASPGRAFTDAELIDGFQRTVFGSEYQSFGWQSRLVKKYVEPVRIYVEDRSSEPRRETIENFVQTLPGLIDGLDVAIVERREKANFHVFVVDRVDYPAAVGKEIYDRPSASFTPGKCLVRVVSTSAGISRSDAVIVGDEGDFLFNRCMVEEILQGFGPINDDRSLSESVFNDMSRHSTFTDFDRRILNMLYHPLVEPGMTKLEVARILPRVVADVQARLR
jgi:hypothetical protein